MFFKNHKTKLLKHTFVNINCGLVLTFLISCSANEKNIFKNSVDVHKSQNILSVSKNSLAPNVKLSKVANNYNILNSFSYNSTNSLVKFPFKQTWKINTDQVLSDESPYFSHPLYIASNIFLINANGKLIKINSENGEVTWSKTIFDNLENSIIGPPAISGEYINENNITIYIHTGNNELFSINGITGKINWKSIFSLPFRGGLTFFQNKLFASDYEGTIFSIDSNNGKVIWKNSLGTDYNSVYTSARPIIAKDKLIVPGTGGSFFVLSLKNGEMKWTDNISSNSQLPKLYHAGDIVANPLYYKDFVYIVSQSGFMSAFNINTSEKIWTLPVGGVETPILSEDNIFVNGNDGNLVAINRLTGDILWHKKYEGRVNIDSYFLNEAIATYKGPVLANSKLLFSDHYGNLRILNPKNGNELDTLSVGKLAIAPLVVDKKVFFLRADGDLLAYE